MTNEITGANAGGLRRFSIRTPWAARIAQFCRSSMAWRVSRITNPEGWQRVAGGRNAVETPGRGLSSFGILEGCQSSATPPGSNGDFGMRSGGVAPAFAALRRGKSLDPRLLSGKPPACCPADPTTNPAAALDGGGPSGFAFLPHRPAASEPRR